MAIQALFPTLISRVRIGFAQALADECQALAASDAAGRLREAAARLRA